MRILVTGSAGFIGSHLCERLLALGHEVWGVDDLSTGRESNMYSFISHPRFSFFNYDLLDKKLQLSRLFVGIDWVFHLAARADVVPSIVHPYDYHHVNVEGTVRLLELSRKKGVQKFIYAASSSCYGIPKIYPTPESAPCSPEYPYALTKYIGEQYVLHYAKVYKLPAVSLRLFNVFGPRARTSGSYGAVFGTFLAQMLNDKPFTVVGDGSQTRDFTYVSDVVNAFIMAALSQKSGVSYNVGSGFTQSVQYLTCLLDPNRPLEYLPKRPGEPDCTFADTTKIIKELGWYPQTPFKEGVEKLLENKAEFKDAPVWTKDTITTATSEWFKYLGDA